MRENGDAALLVNPANRVCRLKVVRNFLGDIDRENMAGLAFDFLPDNDEKILNTLAQILRQGDVVEIRNRNAIKPARFNNPTQIVDAMMPANVDVEIEFHAKILALFAR